MSGTYPSSQDAIDAIERNVGSVNGVSNNILATPAALSSASTPSASSVAAAGDTSTTPTSGVITPQHELASVPEEEQMTGSAFRKGFGPGAQGSEAVLEGMNGVYAGSPATQHATSTSPMQQPVTESTIMRNGSSAKRIGQSQDDSDVFGASVTPTISNSSGSSRTAYAPGLSSSPTTPASPSSHPLKPLPGLPMLSPERDREQLNLADGHFSPATPTFSSAIPPIDTLSLPPQHIPRPISISAARNNSSANAQQEKPTPPVPFAESGSFTGQTPPVSGRLDASQLSMSPPDPDPARTLAESNRSSIDDIRKVYAMRKANGISNATAAAAMAVAAGQPSTTYNSPPPPPTVNGVTQGPASAFQTPVRKPTVANAEMQRPSSVLETRSARQEAAQRQQLRHSSSTDGSASQVLPVGAVGLGHASIGGTATPVDNRSIASSKTDREREKERERRSRRTLGDYVLGKTLGAGSMGKVKLGVKMGNGEKVAVKIIPRHTSVTAAHHAALKAAQKAKQEAGGTPEEVKAVQPSASYLQKAYAKDQSKEIRTIREGSLQLLLHHPYVCGMREMIIHPNHYYMIFEYVNGGQMLDYIISHGRLRERAARKFARQIASALEYCHRNSVIHRDLKIENILISKTGNIKIIDFGLSNLYSPHSNLTTFCGSLYFAAPELLNAKVYTGPEVDVWSFGIVLYVLVCGKVPFDDQSMPALHAKIKRGHVEYPVWLSGECKHILSRMLVTNPQQRATLTDLMNHPWMTKGYDGPPDIHLPKRHPLRAGELDPEVVKGMTGFEFGTPEEIDAHLNEILSSEAYVQTLAHWETKHGYSPTSSFSTNGSGTGADNLALGRQGTRTSIASEKSKTASKRFSGIDFYRKKANSLFGGKEESPTASTNSARTAIGPGGGVPTTLDPVSAYHPLISIYYLVKEKMAREKLYGHSFFASSNISLSQAQISGVSAGGTSMPTAADIPQEEVKVPETSHSSSRAKEPAAKTSLVAPARAAVAPIQVPASPTPVFDSREKSQPSPNMAGPPRPRATGDDLEDALRGSGLDRNKRPESVLASPTNAGAATFDSNHRRSLSFNVRRPTSQVGESTVSTPASRLSRTSATANTNRHSMVAAPTPTETLSTSDAEAGSSGMGTLARRFGSLMSRSPSAPLDVEAREKRRLNRMSTGGMPSTTRRASHMTGLTGVAEGQDAEEPPVPNRKTYEEPDSGDEMPGLPPKPLPPQPPAEASSSPRKESSAVGSLGRTSGTPMSPKKRQSTLLGLKSPAQEFPIAAAGETGGWLGLHNPAQASALPSSSRRENAKGAKEQTASKPIFLKGLFSVQTTSTKPRAVIHATLVNVLDRLGVQYREIKGGYECVHLPSLDFSGGAASSSSATGQGNMRLGLEAGGSDLGERESLTNASVSPHKPLRKGSKLSFTSGKQKRREASESRGSLTGGEEASLHGTRSRTNSLVDPNDTSGLSLRASQPAAPAIAESNQEEAAANAPISKTMSPNAVHELAVRFEIFVVKVPLLLGVNGLQFRRVSGNPWQYQMLAKRVLEDAKL